MNALPCTEGNRSVLKQRLQRVLGAVPTFVAEPLCLKTAYSSDMIAAVQLDPATALPGWSFARYAPPEEVPVEELFRIWPDVFDATARQGLEIAIGFDPVSGAGITLSRLPDGRLYVLLSDRM
ncbi:hypothetical protein [Rhodobacter sp. JA431]|uniref:hypothetical protein n=1 Tax=Rhodobacter sp. JA431 TaxID=570013 RepID=UPI001160CA05|nr:hypothetical protein [Rhodobacter sp. JA431]